MALTLSQNTPDKLVIRCEDHISYKFNGFEYDDILIKVLHPDLKYNFEIDREEYGIYNGYDLYVAVLRLIVTDLKIVVYTKDLC